jgi:hypothetical protein
MPYQLIEAFTNVSKDVAEDDEGLLASDWRWEHVVDLEAIHNDMRDQIPVLGSFL